MNHQRDHVSFYRLLAGSALSLVLCLLVVCVTPRSAHAQAGVCNAYNDWPPNCGCGSYVTLQQFTGKVGGDWPEAKSYASQQYWNNGYVQYSWTPSWQRSWRYRSDVPQAGDVMIMDSGSPFWLQKTGKPQSAVSSGHAGFVLAPAYNASKAFAGDSRRYSGWDLTMKSANFCNDEAASLKTYADPVTTCRNVNEVPIFVPNGDSVSFWRGIKAPIFVAIFPANQSTKKALALSADPNKRTAVVQARRDTRSEEQIWVVETLREKVPQSVTYYARIINYKTGNCLDVSGGSPNNGAPIIEWRCNNGDNQKWRLINPYGQGGIQSKLTGKFLDVPGGTQASNVQIIQWEPNGGSNQQWIFEGAVPPSSKP